MKIGVHLPQIDAGAGRGTLERVTACARAVARAGLPCVTANDNLLFPNHAQFAAPWLDGPVALAAAAAAAPELELFALLLPVHRTPAFAARTAAGLDALSGGRLTAALAAGSAPAAYRLAGVPYEERWERLDEAAPAMRAVLAGTPFRGVHYQVDGAEIRSGAPRPVPPLWVASWGSDAGLRRTARIGDGWLASAYATPVEAVPARRRRLAAYLEEEGRDPAGFPCGVTTAFFHVSDDARGPRRVLEDVLAPLLGGAPDELADRFPVGSAQRCLEWLARYADAGIDRVFLWPVVDVEEQVAAIASDLLPQLGVSG